MTVRDGDGQPPGQVPAPEARPAVHVRRMVPADASAMALLFHETVHRVNASDYSARQLRAWSPAVRSPEAWLRRQTGLHVWVATHGATLLGFAELDPKGIIDCFFVSARHQRMGVGRALMRHVLHAAHELRLGRVEADVSA